MKELLAVGLNPALQKALVFPSLTLGDVNRARTVHQVPGGKGYHFARAANTLSPGCCVVAHFVGGSTGRFVADEHERLDIPQLKVEVAGDTRTCVTVLDEATRQMTELIEPSATISASEVDAMRRQIEARLPDLAGIALCGTFPPGIEPSFYARIAELKGAATLMLDGYRGVEATLKTGQVDVLKINVSECLALTGCDAAPAAAARCRADFGIDVVALTDGPSRAFLLTGDGAWEYHLPALEKVANPIGAGDTVAGVMLSRLVAGDTVVEAFALGLAAATASCTHLEGAEFTVEQMHRFRQQLHIEEC